MHFIYRTPPQENYSTINETTSPLCILSGFAWLLLHLLDLFDTVKLTVLSAYLRLLSTEMQFITFFNEILNLFSDRFLILSKPINYEATTVLAMWLTWFSVILPCNFH